MTQRNLNALRVKTEDVVIGEDLTLKIAGLTFPELTEFGQIGERDKHGASRFLVKTALRKALPASEVSDQDFEMIVKELSAEASLKIIQAVTKLSGIGGDDVKKSETLVQPTQ